MRVKRKRGARFVENSPKILKGHCILDPYHGLTSNLRIDAIKTHETSVMHKDAQKAVTNSRNIRQSEAASALRKLHEANYKRLTYRFRNAHAVAKHDKSFKDYVWLCELDKPKGLDVG